MFLLSGLLLLLLLFLVTGVSVLGTVTQYVIVHLSLGNKVVLCCKRRLIDATLDRMTDDRNDT